MNDNILDEDEGFPGYTDQGQDAIHQALLKAHLKPEAHCTCPTDSQLAPRNRVEFMRAAETDAAELRRVRKCPWHGRILPDITTLVSDVCEGHTHPDTVLFPGTIHRRLKAFRIRLEAVRETYERLGERVQRHFNDQFSPRNDGKFLQIVNDALIAVSHAQERPVHPMIAYVQEQGAPKNHAMRLIVTRLLETFKQTTGIEPTVYQSSHVKDGYAGTFYPFAVACLAPAKLVPRKRLGSAILAVYKEWSRSRHGLVRPHRRTSKK